jgi:hypothetical protein
MANYTMRYINCETCFIILKFKYALSLHRRRINNSDTTCKFVFVCLRVSTQLAPFSLQELFIFGLFINCLFLFINLCHTKALMVFLEHNQEICIRMELEFAWGIPCLDYSLSKLFPNMLNRKDSYCIFCNCNYPFGTSFGAESTCMAESVIA